jgi:hypothetical protein
MNPPKNLTPPNGDQFQGDVLDALVNSDEIRKSDYRGSELIYPEPFGVSVAHRTNPVQYSDFTILGSAAGAFGFHSEVPEAQFPSVNLETTFGVGKGICCKLPFELTAMGSSALVRSNWPSLAAGAAISGVPLWIGENVCGMDIDAKFADGKVISGPELDWRVKCYRNWQLEGYGDVIVQANVEDTMLGVQEYALKHLGVQSVELKWGQSADVGREVKISRLKDAQELRRRGYTIHPDPLLPQVEQAFKDGSFHHFEVHSRIGMTTREAFLKRVEELRKAGAKHVTLKTGAYRPAELARAVKFASEAKLDLLTVDAAAGETGMSPRRMVNAWGIPGIELHALLREFLERLRKKGDFVPDVAVGGGFAFEDQLFKALAMGSPYVKLISFARGPLAVALVAESIAKGIEDKNVPTYIQRFALDVDEMFVETPELRRMLGDRVRRLPTGAIAVYNYFQRLAKGLRQFMAGARKFSLREIERSDVAALTQEASRVSALPMVMDMDREEIETIFEGKNGRRKK